MRWQWGKAQLSCMLSQHCIMLPLLRIFRDPRVTSTWVKQVPELVWHTLGKQTGFKRTVFPPHSPTWQYFLWVNQYLVVRWYVDMVIILLIFYGAAILFSTMPPLTFLPMLCRAFYFPHSLKSERKMAAFTTAIQHGTGNGSWNKWELKRTHIGKEVKLPWIRSKKAE